MTSQGAEILTGSGLFDEAWYRLQIAEQDVDPVEHYLNHGWSQGIGPNEKFDEALLSQMFSTVGFSGPAALTWLLFGNLGWLTYDSLDHARSLAVEIRNSGLFDEQYYNRECGPTLSNPSLDRALHYVLVGEAMRFAPSAHFDPQYYAARNPDIVSARMNLLIHYVFNGRAEGRQPVPCALPQLSLISRVKPEKKTVAVVVHEASRTGAPVLGLNIAAELASKYNVITIALGPGELLEDFERVCAVVYGPLAQHHRGPAEVSFLMSNVLRSHDVEYVIVNSVESREAVTECMRYFVPSVLLVHEFASYYPPHSFDEVFSNATEIIFPAQLVARSQSDQYHVLNARNYHILPQGMSVLPKTSALKLDPNYEAALATIADCRADGKFMVLGAGTVQIRKGVDLFISVAAAVSKMRVERPIHFVWIGHGYDPEKDTDYSSYLKEQIERSGIEEHVTFLEPISDLEILYDAADAFLLPSRVDPLPNVSIDAAVRGIPVVSFRDASGFAEIMERSEPLASCVVDYLDVHAAALKVAALVNDPSFYSAVSVSIAEMAEATFDMRAYVAALDSYGVAAGSLLKQMRADADLLEYSDVFEQATYVGRQPIFESRRSSIARYLSGTATRNELDLENNGVFRRRGTAGFDAITYIMEMGSGTSSDALASFVRAGRPSGPWMPQLITPAQSPSILQPNRLDELRVAIHGHFFYPDLFADFARRLMRNSARPDLYLSVSSAENANRILGYAKKAALQNVTVEVVPNLGRDIGPFLTAFGGRLRKYDVVGHFHGKKSESYDVSEGAVWREFLWQNLLGSEFQMIDSILASFKKNPQLGLVYAADPNMVGWTTNRDVTANFMRKLGFMNDLPLYVEFPNGNMFWCRPAAFARLFDARIGWEDYPSEPLDYDGTLLHAIERSLGLIVKSAGYELALAAVPGITR